MRLDNASAGDSVCMYLYAGLSTASRVSTLSLLTIRMVCVTFRVFLCLYLLSAVTCDLTPASPLEPAVAEHSQRYEKVGSYNFSNNSIATGHVWTMVPHQDSDSVCPPWFIPSEKSGHCECGNTHRGIVVCDGDISNLLSCYCMTYDHGGAVIGQCLTGCAIQTKTNSLYIKLPSTIDELENEMCSVHHRKGQLCGQCEDGFAVPIYSYIMACVKCTNEKTSWLKYIAIVFLPLTIFLVLVLTCRLNASSGRLHGLVMISQLLSCSLQMRVVPSRLELYPVYVRILVHSALAFYGIWSLDFFRLLYEPFCLYQNMTMLEAAAFSYFVALYHIVFLMVIYLLIKLHDSNIRLLVWLWKPFHRCTARYRRWFDVRNSLIHAFVTIYYLSFMKFLTTSVELLLPTTVYSIHEDVKRTTYLYYDGTVEYLGPEHLPYAIIACITLLIFGLFPVLLMIAYQLKCFHRLADYWHLGRTYSYLKIFMDAFQGDYKDGCDGTRDCRYFPVVYFILQVALVAVYGSTLSVFYYPVAAILLLAVVPFIAVVQPYKIIYYNFLDIFLVVNLTGLYVLALFLDVSRFGFIAVSSRVLVIVLIMLPFICTAGYWLYKFCMHTVVTRTFRKLIFRNHSRREETLAHRAINVQEHTPLLASAATVSTSSYHE